MPTSPDHSLRHTFRKPEHLCKERDIQRLFAPGHKSMIAFPLRIVMQRLPHPGTGPRAQVLISVSKRHLRHAVDRNRAKRQIREAYRLSKHTLLTAIPRGELLHLAFIWLSDAPADTALVHKRMKTLLARAADTLYAAHADGDSRVLSDTEKNGLL